MRQVQLVGIVCSLRKDSVNGAAARASLEVTGDATLTLHDIGTVPLYNGDDEAAGPPQAVLDLYDAVRPADGIVLFSPEYNSSLPAVTKNVIDWLSRDPSTWDGSGITMVTMSPGGRAGASVLGHFEAIMPRQATRLFDTIGLGNCGDRVNETGDGLNAETLDELGRHFAAFSAFCVTSPE